MRPKSDKLSWDEDGKTAEAPSSYSQQRKAVKPRMSWGDDARTVARPADAQLPEAAFRPDVIDAIEISEATDAVEGDESPQPVEVSNAPAAVARAAPAPVTEPAVRRARSRAARHPWRRWILLTLTIPAFYLLSYTAVRVAQKLQQSPAGSARSGSSASQVWGTSLEVLQETFEPPRRTPAEREAVPSNAR